MRLIDGNEHVFHQVGRLKHSFIEIMENYSIPYKWLSINNLKNKKGFFTKIFNKLCSNYLIYEISYRQDDPNAIDLPKLEMSNIVRQGAVLDMDMFFYQYISMIYYELSICMFSELMIIYYDNFSFERLTKKNDISILQQQLMNKKANEVILEASIKKLTEQLVELKNKDYVQTKKDEYKLWSNSSFDSKQLIEKDKRIEELEKMLEDRDRYISYLEQDEDDEVFINGEVNESVLYSLQILFIGGRTDTMLMLL